MNNPDNLRVATGLAKGLVASPDLATVAVNRALEKAGITTAQCVILYFTSEFAHAPQAAIRAASKAASCTHVIGCSAIGIFTEEDWVLDGAAVAALVLSNDVFSSQPQDIKESEYLLTLAAPSAMNARWLASAQLRFGAISGDATGHGAFSVWQDGKGVSQGYCALAIPQTQLAVAASHGLKWLSSARKVTASKGFDLQSVANVAALNSLQTACLPLKAPLGDLPLHLISIAYASSAKAFEDGLYQLASTVVANEASQSLTLSHEIPEGYWLRWAIRDAESAQTDLRHTAQLLTNQLAQNPTFACMFSCLARGPYYYGGNDEDLSLLKSQFPHMPIIGFYGNGQIAPTMGKNTLLQHSIVLALFGQTKEPHELI
jgi:small ligand-binding sensory domain FIST